jgi:PAS domain S-box-containing protein
MKTHATNRLQPSVIFCSMRKIVLRIFSGLRLRLLLLVLLACAPLVGLMLHTAWEERRRQVKDWTQRSQEMLELAAREEGHVIGQTRQLLLAVAESSQVRSGNRRDCKKLLDELFGSYPRYANLGVVRTNGMVLASAIPMAEPANQTNRPFFRRALATRAFAAGDFPDGQAVGKPTVNFGYPVFDSAGEIQAVVFAALDLDWVSRFESVLPAQLPQGATWTEIDRTGRILVRYPSPEKWIGQPFPEKSLLKTVFNQDHGEVEAVSPDGVPGYYAFAARRSQFVPDNVVTILGIIPKQSLFAEADRRLTENLTGLGIAACFAFMLGWIGSHFLVLRPVRTLVNSSARLAAGDLTTRTGLSDKGDELGQLTRAFDQMAQALEHRELDHQRAEKELRHSEERFRALVQNSTDVIGIIDERGIILYRSPALQNGLGYAASEVLGKGIAHYVWPEDLVRVQERLAELVKSPGAIQRDEYRLLHRDGSCRHIECTSSNYLHDPAIGGIVFNYREITERKLAEEKFKTYSRKLQVLSRRLVEAQETERRRIARELHDELGQTLTVAQLNLQALLQSPGTDALAPRLQESLEAVERVLEQVQGISLNLRPSILDDLGLEPALRWYTERQAALVGLQTGFHAGLLDQRLDPVIETGCFRIAQEALTNVVRHAQAHAVTVDLRAEDGQLHLRVRDDGAGFDVAVVREEAVRGASLGVLGMEERAALAGGGLEFTSSPKQGTEVHAWFPLKWQTSQA